MLEKGAPYTGLEPAGRDLGPAIPAADKALESGSAEPLVKLLTNTMQEGIQERFKNAVAKKNFNIKKQKVVMSRFFSSTIYAKEGEKESGLTIGAAEK